MMHYMVFAYCRMAIRALSCLLLVLLAASRALAEFIPVEPVEELGELVPATLEWRGSACSRPFLVLPVAGNKNQIHTTYVSKGSRTIGRFIRMRWHQHFLLFSLSRWLDDDKHRLFDMFVLFYGNATDVFDCPECVGIFRRRGAKWRLFYLLSRTPIWDQLMTMYSYFGVPDDDLIMSTHGTQD